MLLRKLLLCFCIGMLLLPLSAQQRDSIVILNAEIFNPITKDTTQLFRFVGQVHMKHNNLLMWCDSLYHFPDRNFVEAYGNVRAIQNDSIHMSSDFMDYDGNRKYAQLRGNVKVRDPQMTLTTENLDYDGLWHYAFYFRGGRLYDNLNTLDSEQGTYFTQTKLAVFRDSVVVNSPDYLIYSDTMRYNTESHVVHILGSTNIYGKGEDNNTVYSEDGWYDTNLGHAELYKNNRVTHTSYTAIADTMVIDSLSQQALLRYNITITDTVNDVIIKGEYGFADQYENRAFVTEKAQMILVGKQDSLFLHSDTLFFNQDSLKNNIIKAYDKTRFYSSDLQGLCDSMVYVAADSLITMYSRKEEPVVWASGYQMTSETISLLLGNGVAREFYLKNDALMISRREDTEMYDQVKGRNITGYFHNNELYRIIVDGNGETIYFPDDKGAVIGVNTASSPNIKINVEERRIISITFNKKTDGELNPLFIVPPEEARLKEFKWLDYLRPVDKYDIFNYRTLASKPKNKNPEEKDPEDKNSENDDLGDKDPEDNKEAGGTDINKEKEAISK